jgi:hypothetical protein
MSFRLPPARSFRFVYQDESGEAGHSSHRNFVVGLLRVRDRGPIWAAIAGVRQREKFLNEMHFSKLSPFRERVYIEVFRAVRKVQREFVFSAIVVRNNLIDISRFSGKRHLAYNFFTKLLLQNRAIGIENAIILTDAKQRIKEDNFFDYLQSDINMTLSRTVIRKIESIDSKSDDVMQLTDLLVGCANNMSPGHVCGDRKTRLRKIAQEIGLIRRSDLWIWRPRKG